MSTPSPKATATVEETTTQRIGRGVLIGLGTLAVLVAVYLLFAAPKSTTDMTKKTTATPLKVDKQTVDKSNAKKEVTTKTTQPVRSGEITTVTKDAPLRSSENLLFGLLGFGTVALLLGAFRVQSIELPGGTKVTLSVEKQAEAAAAVAQVTQDPDKMKVALLAVNASYLDPATSTGDSNYADVAAEFARAIK